MGDVAAVAHNERLPSRFLNGDSCPFPALTVTRERGKGFEAVGSSPFGLYRLKRRFPARCGRFWLIHRRVISRAWAFRLNRGFVKCFHFVIRYVVSDAIKAVIRINSQTPRGEGSGGRFRFTFRLGGVMIVAGRKMSPPCVVCVCVCIVLLVRAFEFAVTDTSPAC